MLTHVSMVALIGLAGGCGLVVTSLVTPHWIVLTDQSHMGLFSHCSSVICSSLNLTNRIPSTGRDVHSQFKAVRGLVITGLIVGICGTLMALGFVVDALRSKEVKSLTLLRSSLVLNPLGGVATLLGASIFAATIFNDVDNSHSSSMGFSFGLCICGGSLMLISGILVFVGGPREVTTPPHEHLMSPSRAVLSCMHPPPIYPTPSGQLSTAMLQFPPAYDVKGGPPSYEEVLLLPPPYDETSVRTTS